LAESLLDLSRTDPERSLSTPKRMQSSHLDSSSDLSYSTPQRKKHNKHDSYNALLSLTPILHEMNGFYDYNNDLNKTPKKNLTPTSIHHYHHPKCKKRSRTILNNENYHEQSQNNNLTTKEKTFVDDYYHDYSTTNYHFGNPTYNGYEISKTYKKRIFAKKNGKYYGYPSSSSSSSPPNSPPLGFQDAADQLANLRYFTPKRSMKQSITSKNNHLVNGHLSDSDTLPSNILSMFNTPPPKKNGLLIHL